MRSRHPFVLTVLMSITLLACLPAVAEQTKPIAVTRPVQEPSRDLPALPTLTSSAPAQSTQTFRPQLPTLTPDVASAQNAQYYTDIMEFDPLHSDFFTHQVVKGSQSAISVTLDELSLWFNITSPNTSIIFIRKDLVYEEVNVSAKVSMEDTQGFVKLICQYDPAIGWYEFNISLDGSFNIKVAEVNDGQIAYTTLYSGETSKTYKNGNENEFNANCTPDNLHFDFNGSKGWSLDVPDTVPHIPRGQVGFGVEAESSLPVKIGFNELAVAQSYY